MTAVSGNEPLPDFNSLSESEQRLVAERLLKIERSGWKPFWCPNPSCDGSPHVQADGCVDPRWAHNHARQDQRLPPWKTPWTLFVMSGRGAGKRLALDTPIPTPSGWTTMGELEIGDEVFDENGEPCRVVNAYEGWSEDPVRFTFSDGTTLDACREHQWVTWTHADRKALLRTGASEFPETWATERFSRPRGAAFGGQIRTTQEIIDSFTLPNGNVKGRDAGNHCIPLVTALNLPEVPLPLDPYLLGFWLGDGSSASAEITVADDDKDEIETYLPCDLTTPKRRPDARCATWRMDNGSVPERDEYGRMTGNGSIHSTLRAMGLLKNKHVPEMYLRASEAQRLDLLRGLMDSDGSASQRSTVEFCSTKEVLARAVVELARSLGEKPVVKESAAKLNGREVGRRWRVTWRPSRAVPFCLRRKAKRITFDTAQTLRRRHRMISDWAPIEPQQMRCIEVDSPSHMYLAGEGMIPTHNTRTGIEFVMLSARKGLDGAILGRRGTELVNTHVAELVKHAHPEFQPTYHASKDLITWPNEATTFLFSAERPENIRSVNLSYAWVDEAAFMDEIETAWMNLRLATRISTPGNPIHFLITSTPTSTPWVMKMEDDPTVEVRRVSTYANRANLDAEFIEALRREYEGTRMGRQELYGEVLRDVEGALWNDSMFVHERAEGEDFYDRLDALDERVLAVDPAGSKGKRSDATGIIGVGVSRDDDGDRFTVFGDATLKGSPKEWAAQTFKAARLWDVSRIIVERNFGGDMVTQTLRDYAALHPEEAMDSSGMEFRIVETRAVKGKETRAEPVVARYEQRRVLHLSSDQPFGDLSKLEKEQVNWVPKSRGGKSPSPNRVDSLVWGCVDLSRAKTFAIASATQSDVMTKMKRSGRHLFL